MLILSDFVTLQLNNCKDGIKIVKKYFGYLCVYFLKLAYQAVVVGKCFGDEDVGELVHQDPLAVQELQIRHGEPVQVVGPEAVKRHQQQRQNLLGCVIFSSQSTDAPQEGQQYSGKHPESKKTKETVKNVGSGVIISHPHHKLN